MPKSRSTNSLLSAAAEDLESAQKIATQLSAELNLKTPISVNSSFLPDSRALHLPVNRTTVRGRPIVTRNKNISQLSNVKAYENIERALVSMKKINHPKLSNNQRAIRALSSMGVATSISVNRSVAIPLERSTTRERAMANPLKKIELDETIADQEYTKQSPTVPGTPGDQSRLTKLTVKQNQYLQRMSGRMCHLWNTGQKGYPNVYSTYRPFVSAGPGHAPVQHDNNASTKGNRIIGDPRLRILVTTRKTAPNGGHPGIASPLSSAQTTTAQLDSGPFRASIKPSDSTY